MQYTLPRPPYDAELAKVLDAITPPPTEINDLLPVLRAKPAPSVNDIIAGQPVTHRQQVITGPRGDITISIFHSTSSSLTDLPHPGIITFHGGGFVSGNRFGSIQNMLNLVTTLDAVCIAVEYRLAPEHPHPAPLEDCYAALLWTSLHLATLRIDAAKLIIAGSSAGAGLAAGVALYARDHNGPPLCAQLLVCPMLDDRNITVSNQQYSNEGTWSGGSNLAGWTALLGEDRGAKKVSIYAAPTRATDLSRLPPAFIEVGSAECLRDECVDYASRLWASGVQAELHVWPGAFHRFQAFAPTAALSVIADRTRDAWVKRVLDV